MATICLDPGHGGPDAGAVRDGLAEKDVTLDIALAARGALREHRVVLTRDADQTLSLPERRRVADEAAADIFVSIHVNAAARPHAQGVEALVREWEDAASTALATQILEVLAVRWPERRNRGIRQAALTVLRQARPACLVECFFISNPEERALLARPALRTALGKAVARGCEAFLQQPPLTVWRPAVRGARGTGRTARRAARSPRPPAPRPA